MAATKQKPELIVIVGPTASGKSDLAMKIAKEFNGEIIAADSRTIYKGMDVGTAKPSKKERKTVPHWGLDLVEPGQAFSAQKYKVFAEEKIKEIQERGKLPVLVGGTGLYIDALIFGFEFINQADMEERRELEKLSTEQLQKAITAKGYAMPENFRNRRHLIRTIERKGKIGTKSSIKYNTLIIGLNPEAEALKERINQRAAAYFERGLLEETKHLLKKYGEKNLKINHGIAYIAALKLINEEISREEAEELIKKSEWQYARRQRTWFKRNKFIRWFGSNEEAYKEISPILNN